MRIKVLHKRNIILTGHFKNGSFLKLCFAFNFVLPYRPMFGRDLDLFNHELVVAIRGYYNSSQCRCWRGYIWSRGRWTRDRTMCGCVIITRYKSVFNILWPIILLPLSVTHTASSSYLRAFDAIHSVELFWLAFHWHSFFQFLKECVRRRVMKSVIANPYCSEAAAKDAMEAVWDVCYNDTQPFDRAPWKIIMAISSTEKRTHSSKFNGAMPERETCFLPQNFGLHKL